MSVISIGAVICLLIFAFHPLFQYVVAALVSLFTAVAIWEYAQFAKAKRGQTALPALLFFTLALVFSFFLSAKSPTLERLPLLVFLTAFLVLFALHFGKKEGAIIDLAVSSFGLLYIAVPMGMVLGILYLPDLNGRWWIAYLLVVTKITDIGAYFAGNFWGRRKLAPHISPKKTIEGALFGLFCAVAASLIFHFASGNEPFVESKWQWLGLGLVLGLIGQFGDLSESLLKRDAEKKDSNALPGIGGVLDSIDSILFNAAILYIYLDFVKL